MAVCYCSLAGTAACQHCSQNPFATDVWTNKTITVNHVEAKPFGNGIDVCPVCGKPYSILKTMTNEDKIKAMSTEDLATFLCNLKCADSCYNCIANEYCHYGHNGFVDWLKQEVE